MAKKYLFDKIEYRVNSIVFYAFRDLTLMECFTTSGYGTYSSKRYGRDYFTTKSFNEFLKCLKATKPVGEDYEIEGKYEGKIITFDLLLKHMIKTCYNDKKAY